MNGHALRGVLSAWLGLIVLQAVGTSGTGQVGNFFGTVNTLVTRALSPNVPAIPDRRTTGTTPTVATGGAVVAPAVTVPAPTAPPVVGPPVYV